MALRDAVVSSGSEGLGGVAYDVATGSPPGQADLRERGQSDYPCYFWTAGFAGYVISRHLRQEEILSLGRAHYLVTFREKEAT